MLSLRAMRYHTFVWQLCGIWPPSSGAGTSRLYALYAVPFFGIFFVIFPGCMVLNLLFVPDLSGVVGTLLICSTCVLAAVKGALVWLKRRHIRQLFAIVGAMDECLVDGRQRIRIEQAVRESRRLVIVLSFMYYGGVNSAFALSQLDRSDRPVLMWPSWYPGVRWSNGGWVLAVVLAYQYVASVLVALLDSSVDVYGAALHKVLGAHLDALGQRLSELGHSAGKNEDGGVRSERHWERELAACARHHQLCIRCAAHIDEIFSVHYAIQFGCSGLILCVSAFQLSEINPVRDWSKFTFVCEYLVSMAIEIFVPCYFGSVVTAKSERQAVQMYAAAWPERSAKFRRAMGVLVERALRPIVPLAAGLVVIGLPTFVAILRAAYSLLSLLKSIDT